MTCAKILSVKSVQWILLNVPRTLGIRNRHRRQLLRRPRRWQINSQNTHYHLLTHKFQIMSSSNSKLCYLKPNLHSHMVTVLNSPFLIRKSNNLKWFSESKKWAWRDLNLRFMETSPEIFPQTPPFLCNLKYAQEIIKNE